MSQTLFVECRGHGFWAYDLVAAVFLHYLIDVAAPTSAVEGYEWLQKTLDDCVTAINAHYGWEFGKGWSAKNDAFFVELVQHAGEAAQPIRELPASEIASWSFPNGSRIFTRGFPTLDTRAVLRLAKAIGRSSAGPCLTRPKEHGGFSAPATSPPRSKNRGNGCCLALDRRCHRRL